MWYTYILQSQKDKKYYIGSTNNLKRRLYEHNSGYNRSTRYRLPLELVYFEPKNSSVEARKREKQIKRFKGGEAFKKLVTLWAGGRAVNYSAL